MEDTTSSVRLENRKELCLTGVREVLSFDETAAEILTAAGALQIAGQNLHMEKLDPDAGQVILTGDVVSLYYPQSAPAEKGGLFSRWLK